jgi:hypothetical protein
MKVLIRIAVSSDRLVAETADRKVEIELPNLVTMEGTTIVAIGATPEAEPGMTVIPGVSIEQFDPAVSSRVIGFLAKATWSARRPQLRGLVAALDRVEVEVQIDGYRDLSDAARRAFVDFLPYHPQMTWFVDGHKVTY